MEKSRPRGLENQKYFDEICAEYLKLKTFSTVAKERKECHIMLKKNAKLRLKTPFPTEKIAPFSTSAQLLTKSRR